MDILSIALVLTFVLLLLLGSGLWVALSLVGVSVFAMMAFTTAPAGSVLATTTWGSTTPFSLIALPLFVWMGEILFRTRLSEDMFRGIAPWVTRLPGRLLARQRGRLRHLRRDIGLVGGDGGDYRAHVDTRAAQAAATTSACRSARWRAPARSAS